jgi:hypothetical protein
MCSLYVCSLYPRAMCIGVCLYIYMFSIYVFSMSQGGLHTEYAYLRVPYICVLYILGRSAHGVGLFEGFLSVGVSVERW